MADNRFNEALRQDAQSRRARAWGMEKAGMSRAEIARTLDVSLSTVQDYLHRGQSPEAGPLLEARAWFRRLAGRYPDPERRAWVRRQAAAWLARREEG